MGTTAARRLIGAIALAAGLTWLGSVARAQPGDAGVPPPPLTSDLTEDPTDDSRADSTEDSSGGSRVGSLAARLGALEARAQERERRLDDALARVDALERELEEGEAEPAGSDRGDDGGPNVRPIASMFTRLEVREGYAALGAGNPGCFPGPNDGECVRFRARLGLDVGDLRVSDDVVAGVRFLPQVSGFWSFGGSGGVAHPAMRIYEANLYLAIGRAARLEVGRIVLNYGDQRVLGALGWHPAARSFDGARLRITPDESAVYVDAFWTMLLEGGPGGFGQGDAYFYGVYAGLGPALGDGVTLDVYALGLQTNDATDPASGNNLDWSVLVHLGARFAVRLSIVDLRAEGGLQLGRRGRVRPMDAQAVVAGHLDGEVGLNLLDDKLRFSLQGLYASGDTPSSDLQSGYTQLFPTAHAFLGLSDVFGARTNVSSAAAHLVGRPIEGLALKLDVHVLMRNRVSGGDNYSGTEADAQIVWSPGAGLRVRGLYALFIPNEAAWALGADPVHYVEVELAFAYGR